MFCKCGKYFKTLSDDDNKLAERMASMCKTTRMSGNLKNTKF